ncbi:MAG TPA: four helix bundle protein [Pyrinomonadaceae bacterium]|nr:four helix bundle protein [Pyrinomonadaceae bacterium]
MGSRSYRDLVGWQKSVALCKAVYLVCETFPRSEVYGLSSQMKRAAVSVASNIAEGQARQHTGEFRQFLAIANGSLAELDTQRVITEELDLMEKSRSGELEVMITEIRKMIYALSAKIS